ncbi:MAG: metal ABC transporter permease [Defluviitaleaceae bacterium]|nr:metal ABC transporter permease [Defluviitaleaceae bacterium]MCL2262298.1 metal ABC transporter permease [Defluviitaleaceae bacterium]
MSVAELLRFPFTQYALAASVLMAICAALIGVPLVLKRYSFMGFGLSNVAFMGMAFALVIDMENSMALVMPLTVVATVLLIGLGNRFKQVSGDASLAMLTVGSLAIGHFVINTFSIRGGNIDRAVSETLFGGTRLVTLNARPQEVWLALVITVLVVIFYLFFYRRIYAVTFDTEFMQATGQHPIVYELMLSVITGVVIAMSMSLLGSLLTASLIIFPALSAMRLSKTYKGVLFCAVIIAAVCSPVGIFTALLFELPPTTTIIMVNIAAFVLLTALSALRKLLA